MRKAIYLWIEYAKKRWYWVPLCLLYKVAEDAILSWINGKWGIAMEYLNYVPPMTGYFLIPIIFVILFYKTYKQVCIHIEHDWAVKKFHLRPISIPQRSVERDSIQLGESDKTAQQPKTNEDKIKITGEIKNNEIVGLFFNDTPLNLRCDIWIAELKEWTERFGYLDASDFKAVRLVRNANIKRQNRYDTYTKLISRDMQRRKELHVRGYVDGNQDREQVFPTQYPANIWRLKIEARTESETIGGNNLFFRCPIDRGFELTEDPEIKLPS